MENASTNYSPRPWMQYVPNPEPQPNSYEAFIEQRALAPVNGTVTEEQIREMTGPLTQIVTFPPRFGYADIPLRIEDVADVDNLYERVDFSGRKSGYTGSSLPALGNGYM